MGKAIVLSESRGHFRHWADQFVSADPDNRDTVLVDPRTIRRNPSTAQLLRHVESYYGRAAQLAGRNGCLIISLGHGGASATDSTVGMVDLLPNRALRVQAFQLRYGGSDEEDGDLAVLSRVATQRVCRGVLGRYDMDSNTRRAFAT